MRTRVKICCISTPLEAEIAVQFGVDALGLVSTMPSGPGVISEAEIATIIACIPPPIASFLLTAETMAEAIVSQYQRCNPSVIQLVDRVPIPEIQKVKQNIKAVKLVQVIHILNQGSVDEALAYAPYVDSLLLDSGNPALTTKQLGGTGRTHNWALSRAIVQQASCPVFLAGGLNPQNIQQAVRQVQPWGVDICSGVRTEDRLDAQKLQALFQALADLD